MPLAGTLQTSPNRTRNRNRDVDLAVLFSGRICLIYEDPYSQMQGCRFDDGKRQDAVLQAARHLLQAKVSGQHIQQAWARRARFRAQNCPDLSSQYRRTDLRDQLNLTDFQPFAYDTARYMHF